MPNERCQASLRTALWRIRQADHTLVHSNRTTVDLDREVRVDLHDTLDQAHRLLSGDARTVDIDVRAESLRADLLPDWDEDWVLVEREQLRQLRLHALEALARANATPVGLPTRSTRPRPRSPVSPCVSRLGAF